MSALPIASAGHRRGLLAALQRGLLAALQRLGDQLLELAPRGSEMLVSEKDPNAGPRRPR